jgi:hypothetical protein
MIYNGEELNTIGDIFNKALSFAKYRDKEGANNFLKAYASFIYNENAEIKSFDEALKTAKHNLGYFAGYYDKQTCDLIYETYVTEHPIFGKNPFGVSPEDAFKAGLEAGYKYK